MTWWDFKWVPFDQWMKTLWQWHTAGKDTAMDHRIHELVQLEEKSSFRRCDALLSCWLSLINIQLMWTKLKVTNDREHNEKSHPVCSEAQTPSRKLHQWTKTVWVKLNYFTKPRNHSSSTSNLELFDAAFRWVREEEKFKPRIPSHSTHQTSYCSHWEWLSDCLLF